MNRREAMGQIWEIFLVVSFEIADRAYQALPEKLKPMVRRLVVSFFVPNELEKPVAEEGAPVAAPSVEDETVGARIGDLLKRRGTTRIV